ncbi:hypothetical protein L9F63_023787, partial [Diploptera punctata]
FIMHILVTSSKARYLHQSNHCKSAHRIGSTPFADSGVPQYQFLHPASYFSG